MNVINILTSGLFTANTMLTIWHVLSKMKTINLSQVSQLYVHHSICLKVIRSWLNLPTGGHGHAICMGVINMMLLNGTLSVILSTSNRITTKLKTTTRIKCKMKWKRTDWLSTTGQTFKVLAIMNKCLGLSYKQILRYRQTYGTGRLEWMSQIDLWYRQTWMNVSDRPMA